MNKVFFSVLFFVMSGLGIVTSYAQSYSSDAMLVSTQDNVAVVRSSGIAAKKKGAIEAAVKSVLHTYLFLGIEGLNDGLPLLGKNPSAPAEKYAQNMLESGRYLVFIKGYTPDEKASKTISKQYQAVVSVELYADALYKDLLNNQIISKDADRISLKEAQEEISLPTIMVLPYCNTGQTYLESVKANSDMRMAIAKVNEGFIKQRVETKDFEQSLRNSTTYQATQGDLSLNDAILMNSGADVAVYVDISKDVTAEGTRVSLRLSAVEAANGRNIASAAEVSGRKKANADMICGAMVEYMISGFLKQVSTGMASKIAKGNSISVRFTISQGCDLDMDTEVEGELLPLSDVLTRWIKANAKNGKYHQQGRSATLLSLDEIQIANKGSNGNDMDVNDFSLELYKYLRKLNLTIKRDVVGNSIDITIL